MVELISKGGIMMSLKIIGSFIKKVFNIKSKTIHVWLLSYFVIFLIPIITSVLILYKYQTALTKQAEEINQNIVNNVKKNVQSTIEEVRNFYSYVVNYQDLNQILSINTRDNYFNNRTTMMFLQNFSYYSKQNNYRTILYIQHTDSIFSQSGIFDSQLYYDIQLQNSYITYEKWIDILQKDLSVGFHTFQNPHTNEITLIYNIEYKTSEGKRIVVSTWFDKSLFFKDIDPPKWLSMGDLYISGQDGNILATYTSNPISSSIRTVSEISKVYNNKYNIFHNLFNVDFTLMTISIVSLKKAINQHILQLQWFSFTIMLICIVCSILAIIFFIRMNYKPILEFLNMLNIKSTNDEFGSIRTVVEHILSENISLSNQTERYINKQRELILSKCLSGDYSDTYVNQEITAHNIQFDYPYIAVCALHILNINRLFSDYPNLNEEKRMIELKFILDNIFYELFSIPGYSCDILETGNYILFLVNSNDKDDILLAQIQKIMDFGLYFIKEHFSIEISYSVSGTSHTVHQIPVARNEALYLLNYKIMMDIKYPILFNDFNIKTDKTPCFLTLQTEQMLINSIITGDFEHASQYINNIFENLRKSPTSLTHLRCVCIDIASVLYKIPYQSSDALPDDYFNAVMEHSIGIGDMQKFLLTNIKKLCQKYAQKNISYKENRMDVIIKYIEENYHDMNLNLNFISNKFNIYPGYLSKQFKNYTGESVNDYISKVRINKAKEIIKDSNYAFETLEKISTLVGFSSVRTFNRTFQKLEGVSPSLYKKSVM